MLLPELLAYLFPDDSHPLAADLRSWLASSRRFMAFAVDARSKIRKKLRDTQGHESLLDLRLELEVAYLLLHEKQLSLAYELQHAGHSRSPDFTVSYTTSLSFMLEVTRLRADQKRPAQAEEASQAGPQLEQRLTDTICNKLQQLLSQRSNVLLVGVGAIPLSQANLRVLMVGIQQRAERSDPAFLQRYGFRDRAAFFQSYQRLSELILLGPERHTHVVAWVNPQARHELPSKVHTALYHALEA